MAARRTTKKPLTPRRYSTTVVHPFTIFIGKRGGVGVRIGKNKPFFSAAEVSLNAGLSIITIGPDGGLLVSGDGVVRRHGNTIAVTA